MPCSTRPPPTRSAGAMRRRSSTTSAPCVAPKTSGPMRRSPERTSDHTHLTARHDRMNHMTEPTPGQGTHFWFMVIQTPNATGLYVNSYQGTWTPQPEETRLDVFNAIRSHVEER